MHDAIRRRLATTPRLLAAYLVWGNRCRRRGPWLLGAAVLGAGTAAALAASATTNPWLVRHMMFLCSVTALASCVLVARRRAVKRSEAAHAWWAALPVEKWTARWEALAVDLGPAVACMALLMAVAPAALGAALSAAVLVGALVSYWAPTPKPEELPPGSRYVPQRSAARDPIPRGSLSALGIWPVRQMFASARPKTVARAVVPVLLGMPLGSTADMAMLAIGMFAVLGAFALLLAALIAVNRQAGRWLRPTPLGAGALAARLLGLSLVVMLGMAAVETWLSWVMTSSRR